MWFTIAAALAGGAYEVTEGARPPLDLHTAVHAHALTIQPCFHGADTTVEMRIRVEPDGFVSDVKYSSTNIEVATCLSRQALKLRLRARKDDPGPTTFRWMASLGSVGSIPKAERPPPGTFWVNGGLTKKDIQGSMERNAQSFNYCFRQARVRDPDMSGDFDLEFLIDANGDVASAKATHSSLPSHVTQCIADRVSQLHFPKPTTGEPVQVVAPFSAPSK